MNYLSVLSLEQEINLLLKFGMGARANPADIGLFERLYKVKDIFTSPLIKDNREDYKSNIKDYCQQANNIFPELKLNPDVIFNQLQEKIDNLISCKKIAFDGYEEMKQISNNLAPNEAFDHNDKIKFFLIFKSIRDLLIKDISIVGKKQVDSYLENYRKIFYNNISVYDSLLEVIQNCQAGMLLCYERQFSWAPHYHGEDDSGKYPGLQIFKDILDEPHIITQRFKSDQSWNDKLIYNRTLRELDLHAPSVDGNLLFSTAVHTIDTKSGQKVEAKLIANSQDYKFPVGSTLKKRSKIYFLNELFKDDRIGISFKDEDDLKLSYLKLKTYSDLTGDKEMSDPYKILFTAINRETVPDIEEIKNNLKKSGKTDEDIINSIESSRKVIAELIEKFKNSFSYKRILDKGKKLKIIFRLNFDAKTIDCLKDNIIIQQGDEVKLMKKEDNSLSPVPNIKDLENLKKLTSSSLQSTAYYSYFNLLKSLDSEINNLFSKLS